MQPGDRAAVDVGLEQQLIDCGKSQHRGVGAAALDRQVEALCVAVAVGIPMDLVDAPAFASDRDFAALFAGVS